MAFVTADRVCETTTTTGTGNVTLAGAVAGHQTFAAEMANNDTCDYAIEAVDADGIPTGDWETGTGTYVSATPALARSVLRSSNSDALVNFSAGTKRVYITRHATSGQTINDLTTDATPDRDADFVPFWDTSAGTTDKATLTNLRDVLLGAGSATAGSWPVVGSGTLLTTPEAGAIERDATNLYGTTDAGNRGIIPIIHFIRRNATRTLPNDTAENAIFNDPTNGRITLEAGTYMFEALMQVTSMSATSGNALIDWLGAGTATAAAWMWQYLALDNNTPTTGATNQGAIRVTQDSAASIATAGAGTGLNVWARGTFEITAGGTLIPSIDQVTAAAAVVGIGSFFMCYRIGTDSVVSVGQWD